MSNARRRLIATATSLALVSGAVATPSTTAQETSTIDDVFLGVGANETEALINWTTYTGDWNVVEYVQYAPASAMNGGVFPVEAAQQVQGHSKGLTFEALRYAMSAQITGLEANTDYVYRIGSDERGWTDTMTLSTGDFDETWEFSVFGDPQVGASGDTTADGDGWRAATAAAVGAHPETSMLLSVGDQIDWTLDGLTQQSEYDEFFNNDQLTQLRTAVNRGNHDVSKAYGEMFDLPNTDADWSGPYQYYYERNNALFVALDTNTLDLESQKQFLRETVEAHGGDKDWVIVTYHHSTYSQAYHQTDSVVQSFRDEGMVDLMSELGVDAVFAGHDHIHTRSHLMNGNTPVDADQPSGPGDVLHPEENEVLYITSTSSSGSKFYDFAVEEAIGYSEYPNITTMEQSDAEGLTAGYTAYWVQDHTPDYTQVEITPDTMVITTYNVADGSMVDQVTLDKTGGAEETPGETTPPEETPEETTTPTVTETVTTTVTETPEPTPTTVTETAEPTPTTVTETAEPAPTTVTETAEPTPTTVTETVESTATRTVNRPRPGATVTQTTTLTETVTGAPTTVTTTPNSTGEPTPGPTVTSVNQSSLSSGEIGSSTNLLVIFLLILGLIGLPGAVESSKSFLASTLGIHLPD